MSLILAYAILFLCLPVPHDPTIAKLYPWWANRITFGKVVLHEVLFIVWILIYGWHHLLRSLYTERSSTILIIACFAALAIWCGISSIESPLAMLDLGRTFRLLLNIALLLAVIRWARLMPNYTLSVLILGAFVGTMINLIISIQFPYMNNDVFRLSGQNTPGVVMSLALHLTAWLFFRSQNKYRQVFSVVAASFFLFGSIISFSRIAWFTASLGLLSWVYILFILPWPQQRKFRHYLIRFIPLIIFCSQFAILSQIPLRDVNVAIGQEKKNNRTKVVKHKSLNVNDGWLWLLVKEKLVNRNQSNSVRWSYFIGTTEIIKKNPLGVGYSGFYDAMISTAVYKSGKAANEVSNQQANPHSTFLWYATAGGIPGLVLAVSLFVLLLNKIRIGFTYDMGRHGLVLFVLIALPFLLIGLTVTYLFNSVVMIVPAALAVAWGEPRGALR